MEKNGLLVTTTASPNVVSRSAMGFLVIAWIIKV